MCKKTILFVLAPLMLAGCPAHEPEDTSYGTEAYASTIIAEKVTVASEAQRQYAADAAEGLADRLARQTAFDHEIIDIDYIGKPEALIQTLAYRYGYQYLESGKRRDLRIINVRVQRQKPVEVLRNIGRQVDAGADIELDHDAKAIRILYKKEG